MRNADIAERLTDALALDIPPIALTFTNSPPEGVAGPDRVVPGACAFWRMAEKGVFYAPPATHHTCGVGAATMGFSMTKGIQQEIQGLIRDYGEMMPLACAGTAVVAPGSDLPHAADPDEPGVLYGPLADFPMPPEVVLCWLIPRHAMTFNKVASLTDWGNDPVLVPPSSPSCSGVPIARSSDTATLTLGCAGLRTYTAIAGDRMLGAIPGRRLETVTHDLERLIAQFEETVTYCRGQVKKFDAIDESKSGT
jgi:uncharacterized protein (DUF169 family)